MTQPVISQFTVTGTLKDFTTKSKNLVKSIKLVANEQKYTIKIAEELANNDLKAKLKDGCLLKVTGIKKNDVEKGKVKYEAYKIDLVSEPNAPKAPAASKKLGTTVKPKAKVLFCKKSTCWKKGGKAAYENTIAALKHRGIANRVEVKTVGCLKQCKKAPNMVIMPDKARYSKVKPKEVSKLITKHLLSKR